MHSSGYRIRRLRVELPRYRLTEFAVEAFRKQIAISGPGPYLFPNPDNPSGYQASFKKVWATTLRKAEVPYFRIYDLRSTYATRLSAGGVADEWVTQLLRQGDAKVFKKYSQMKLQMKREALAKLNRKANDKRVLAQERPREGVLAQFWHSWSSKWRVLRLETSGKSFVFREVMEPPAGIEPATC